MFRLGFRMCMNSLQDKNVEVTCTYMYSHDVSDQHDVIFNPLYCDNLVEYSVIFAEYSLFCHLS